MTTTIEERHADLHRAQDAAAAGQRALDALNDRILAAGDRHVAWHELSTLYAEESRLFRRQAELMAEVAREALALASIETGS